MDGIAEIFVDAFGEISFKHGMMRIELVSLSGPEPRVMQRLIMGLPAFQQILQAQQGMLGQLEKAGVVHPRPKEAPEAEASPEDPEDKVHRLTAPPRREPPASEAKPQEAGAPRSPNFAEAGDDPGR